MITDALAVSRQFASSSSLPHGTAAKASAWTGLPATESLGFIEAMQARATAPKVKGAGKDQDKYSLTRKFDGLDDFAGDYRKDGFLRANKNVKRLVDTSVNNDGVKDLPKPLRQLVKGMIDAGNSVEVWAAKFKKQDRKAFVVMHAAKTELPWGNFTSYQVDGKRLRVLEEFKNAALWDPRD